MTKYIIFYGGALPTELLRVKNSDNKYLPLITDDKMQPEDVCFEVKYNLENWERRLKDNTKTSVILTEYSYEVLSNMVESFIQSDEKIDTQIILYNINDDDLHHLSSCPATIFNTVKNSDSDCPSYGVYNFTCENGDTLVVNTVTGNLDALENMDTVIDMVKSNGDIKQLEQIEIGEWDKLKKERPSDSEDVNNSIGETVGDDGYYENNSISPEEWDEAIQSLMPDMKAAIFETDEEQYFSRIDSLMPKIEKLILSADFGFTRRTKKSHQSYKENHI